MLAAGLLKFLFTMPHDLNLFPSEHYFPQFISQNGLAILYVFSLEKKKFFLEMNLRITKSMRQAKITLDRRCLAKH